MEISKGPKKPTIRDIARSCGVSMNTVSRVLNEKTGVSPGKRAQILQVMESLDYHPHIGARSMRSKRTTGCIGVTLSAPPDVVPVSQRFLVWLFSELYVIFGARGERICFDLNPHGATLISDYGRCVWENLFTVCLVAGPLASNDTIVERIHKSGVPYLALSRLDRFPECSCATVDYEKATYWGTKYLLGRGHRKVAMLKAFTGYQPGVERYRGYVQAMKEAGLPVDERLIRAVSFNPQQMAATVHGLLADEEVTGLLDCSGSEDGASIREGARRAGRVPGQDFEAVCWTYEDGRTVLREACAHIWLPVQEAASDGLRQLAAWYFQEQTGPIHVVYPPLLTEGKAGSEVSVPQRLFIPVQ